MDISPSSGAGQQSPVLTPSPFSRPAAQYGPPVILVTPSRIQ
jgi:hypothetical protein